MTIDKINSIKPTKKDIERVKNFDTNRAFGKCSWYGNHSPFTGNASKMAKLIKNPIKMVQRAKAVVKVWGTRDYTGYSAGQPITENVWNPFEDALRDLGFNYAQIEAIKSYRETKEDKIQLDREYKIDDLLNNN